MAVLQRGVGNAALGGLSSAGEGVMLNRAPAVAVAGKLSRAEIARYRDLPEEFDAFFVEEKVEKGYVGGTP